MEEVDLLMQLKHSYSIKGWIMLKGKLSYFIPMRPIIINSQIATTFRLKAIYLDLKLETSALNVYFNSQVYGITGLVFIAN